MMTPLRFLLHTDRGCNHRSFACPSYSVDVRLLWCPHRRSHLTGPDPTNFWESNTGPAQNCVANYNLDPTICSTPVAPLGTLKINNEPSHLVSELSAGRMDPRVGSGRVGSRFCRILAGRVGSALRIFNFLLIISWYLNRYESSNSTFGLIDFLRYLIYNN